MSAESAAGPGGKRLEIKKYPNRRYYDATRSRHVTLEEIYALIREGHEVRVVDSKTGQDITPKVLAQIIIELDSPKLGVFPVPMLHRLLRSNQELVNDFIQKYFNQPLTAFLDSQRNMEQYFRQAMGIQSPSPTMAEWAKMLWGPFSPAFWAGGTSGAAGGGRNQSAGGAAPETGAVSANGSDQELREQLDGLRRQVAELQEQLAGRKRKKPTRRDG